MAIDTMSSLGLTMSQKWAYKGIDTLAKRVNVELRHQIHDRNLLFYFSHDNVNIQFRVYEQRIDRQSHFDSGTATTIYLVPDSDGKRLDNPRLQEQRKIGRTNPITAKDIIKGPMSTAKRVVSRMRHWILQFLLDSPDFDLEKYDGRSDARLKPPPPVHELPTGRENQIIQHMLPTLPIDEATYNGNDQVMDRAWMGLGLHSVEEMKKTGLERVVVWAGDQLTVSRLRGLANFRSHDDNSFERMAYLIPMFGWFHLQMAFATSLHTQYYGTKAAFGFSHAFDVMGKKGLSSTATQGTFHYTFEEALKEVAIARFRDLWKEVAGVKSLGELRSRKPEELLELAERIHRGFASTEAIVNMDNEPKEAQDQLLRQMAQFNRDLLEYLELDLAIKVGDVGRMEDMLPRLLFRFIGGRNHKYAVEILELLQGLHREWPEDIRQVLSWSSRSVRDNNRALTNREYVRTKCWLVNTSGRRDGFYPVDLAQEHNVRDIKVSG